MKRAVEIKTAASSFPVTTQRIEWKPESRALFLEKRLITQLEITHRRGG